ncbi:DgyrCDS9225 [Dimorphilus gyrociliatus]|uniref:DgyrCDS9225 n=1 Tax=Dimorphilus gyrociliatus TaxID=2664684 RepID=A0A7I8VWE0_9ANNE|nr:DgyrCDS9225 [Dimorphilus gyrociliatus]
MSSHSIDYIHLDLSDEENMEPELIPLVEIKVPSNEHADYIMSRWVTLSNEDHGTVYRKIHIEIGEKGGKSTIRSKMVNKYSKPWFVHIVHFFVDEYNFIDAKELVYPIGKSFYNLICMYTESMENEFNVRIVKNNLTQSDVTIKGKDQNISNACRKINNIIEEYLNIQIDLEKERMNHLEDILRERTSVLFQATFAVDAFCD